jgi:hypothetical protein
MTNSEVARIKAEIERTYLAAKLGLSGLASGTSRHNVINVKQERLSTLHEELQAVVGAKQAIQMVAETLAQQPEVPSQQAILTAIRQELGQSEATDQIVQQIEHLWETRDLLVKHLGPDVTRRIMQLSPVCTTTEHHKS